MWLQAGKEVAIVGTRNGHALVMGYSGLGYRTERIIAEDGGIGAPDGRIVDLAPSPDGMVLALAVASLKEPRLDVVMRDLISEGAANPVSNFDGEFDSVSIGWLGEFSVPLALRRPFESRRRTSRPRPSPVLRRQHRRRASSGLYIINISGVVTTGYLKLNCKMSPLSWSPEGMVAAGVGRRGCAADNHRSRARNHAGRINAQAPIRVLDWAPRIEIVSFPGNQSNRRNRHLSL